MSDWKKVQFPTLDKNGTVNIAMKKIFHLSKNTILQTSKYPDPKKVL